MNQKLRTIALALLFYSLARHVISHGLQEGILANCAKSSPLPYRSANTKRKHHAVRTKLDGGLSQHYLH